MSDPYGRHDSGRPSQGGHREGGSSPYPSGRHDGGPRPGRARWGSGDRAGAAWWWRLPGNTVDAIGPERRWPLGGTTTAATGAVEVVGPEWRDGGNGSDGDAAEPDVQYMFFFNVFRNCLLSTTLS